jgi:hypothetical protein
MLNKVKRHEEVIRLREKKKIIDNIKKKTWGE